MEGYVINKKYQFDNKIDIFQLNTCSEIIIISTFLNVFAILCNRQKLEKSPES